MFPPLIYNKICGYLNFHECYYVGEIHYIERHGWYKICKVLMSTNLKKIYDFFEKMNIKLQEVHDEHGLNFSTMTNIIAMATIYEDAKIAIIKDFLLECKFDRYNLEGCQCTYTATNQPLSHQSNQWTNVSVYVTQCPCNNKRMINLDNL